MVVYVMVHEHREHHIPDDDRREFLKVLGITGSVAAGSATLHEVRDAVSAGSTPELAPIGQSIRSDLAGSVDASLLANQQAELADAATALTAAVERGLPVEGPREEFESVAAAGRPVYDHFQEIGFFESTTEHLPTYTPAYLESAVEEFVGSEALTAPLEEFGLSGEEGVDLVATVVANAEELSDHHWVATDEIPREALEYGEHIPPMTMGASGGTLLWLEDLDHHLWQKHTILTQDSLEDAVWHGRSMAAGFYLMSEGARAIADNDGTLSESELGALLSTGFAVQAIAQGLLPEDVYWVTESMRDSYRTDLRTITPE